MMRRSRTSGVAGNCSCCLVPALLLLAIIVAAVIGSAVVWHSAMPSVFRWDSGRHHHYDAYRDGYEEGKKLGADYARRGDREPRGQDLDALALSEADRLHVRRDRGQWIEGFRNGFTRGFEEFSNQASNEQQARWSRLAARPDFPAEVSVIDILTGACALQCAGRDDDFRAIGQSPTGIPEEKFVCGIRAKSELATASLRPDWHC